MGNEASTPPVASPPAPWRPYFRGSWDGPALVFGGAIRSEWRSGIHMRMSCAMRLASEWLSGMTTSDQRRGGGRSPCSWGGWRM
jgi:hypothetical protein